MKLQQSFSFFLAVSAFSQLSSVVVHAKKHSIKGHGRHLTNDDSTFAPALTSTRTSHSKIEHELPTAAEKETAASSPAVLPSPSSSLLRRGLKDSSSSLSLSPFFFQECSSICNANGGLATMPDGSTTITRPATIDAFKSNKDMYCCKGGVSYLKVIFNATVGISGTITLNATVAEEFASSFADNDNSPSCVLSQSQANRGSKGTKADFFQKTSSQSSSTPELRIVECLDDSCIQQPFSNACGATVPRKKEVGPGEEVCFAMVDPNTNNVVFGQKMDINMYVWFLSGEGEVSMGAIHTSCSVPLSQSWAVPLRDACGPDGYGNGNRIDARNSHIEISDGLDADIPHLSFIDGISTEYFESIQEVLEDPDTVSYAQDFSIGFNTCGCTCESFSTSTDAPSVGPTLNPSTSIDSSSAPSESPTPYPTTDSSSAPSESPTPNPTTDPSSAPSESPTPNPTTDPSPAPIKEPSVNPTSDSSSAPSEGPTSSPTSSASFSSSPGDSIGNQGPGSPSGSSSSPSCSSTCAQYIRESCVFAGTIFVCDINAGFPTDIPTVFVDNQEGTESATLPPSAPATGTSTENGTGKFGKGAKGKNGLGKSWTKSEKGAKSGDKLEKSASKSGVKSDKSKGKGGKGGPFFFNSGDQRRLQKIEYHQSRIEYFKELLMHVED